jgi:RNA polymerase sigma factor (sigma-70 family)
MARGFNGPMIGHLRTLFEVGAVGSMTDGELLGRFLEDREHSGEAAFEVLVHRHGPMVLGICRRTLRDSQDSEDAFQATFLILATKARSIRNRESLGSWLLGVAFKVSARARGQSARRQRLDSRLARPEFVPESPSPWDFDEVSRLNREVEQLPGRLREAVVLCYWQGLTYEEAATLLGVTEATIRGRLARARDLLRVRLGASPLASIAGNARTPSPLPLPLVDSTARAATSAGSGRALTGLVPGSVITLMKGVSPLIFAAKWKLTTALVLAVLSVLGAGSVVLAWQKPGDRDLIVEPSPKLQKSAQTGKVEDPSLARLVDGTIVRSDEVLKDCMILSYLPDWNFGNVDNIGFEGHDGGVRTLVNWPDLTPSEARSKDLRFYLAFYARKSVENANPARKAVQQRMPKTALQPVKPGTIAALAISGDWRETTSWKTRPLAEPDTVGIYQFEPGDGWKVFDVTSFVRASEGRMRYGLMFRYINEERPGDDDWTGYQIVSREGVGEWADKRPRFLVVDSSRK